MNFFHFAFSSPLAMCLSAMCLSAMCLSALQKHETKAPKWELICSILQEIGHTPSRVWFFGQK